MFAVPVAASASRRRASGGDANYNDISVLCHFNGTNGSTTFVDDGPAGHSMTAVGNAQLTTSRKTFGSASLELDGTGDAVGLPDSTDFDMGSGNFALECFAIFDSFNTYNVVLASHFSGSAGGYFFHVSSTGYIALYNGSTFVTASSGQMSTGTEYFISWYQNGSNFGMSVDGTEVYSGAVQTVNRVGSVPNAKIGKFDNSGAGDMDGMIDEFRLTLGTDRGYVGAGAPIPVGEFPNS